VWGEGKAGGGGEACIYRIGKQNRRCTYTKNKHNQRESERHGGRRELIQVWHSLSCMTRQVNPRQQAQTNTSRLQRDRRRLSVLQYGAVWRSVVHCVAVRCSVLRERRWLRKRGMREMRGRECKSAKDWARESECKRERKRASEKRPQIGRERLRKWVLAWEPVRPAAEILEPIYCTCRYVYEYLWFNPTFIQEIYATIGFICNNWFPQKYQHHRFQKYVI